MSKERTFDERPRTRGGALLARWMSKKGFTQKQVASALGVSQQSVSSWLRGDSGIKLAQALRLKQVAGISVEAWLEAAPDDKAA